MRVVSIADGSEVVEAIQGLTPQADGWVHATGHVEEAELRVATEGADARRSLRGRYTLVSLSGPFGGPFGVVLARGVPSGVETVGGQLLRALSLGVNLALFDGARAPARGEEPAAAPEAAGEPRQKNAEPEAGGSSWAAMARARAAALRRSDDDDEEARPERGDIVNHFAFGACEVIRADGDRLKIRDLHGPGRIREVSIEMLDVKQSGERDGKRVFRLSRKS